MASDLSPSPDNHDIPDSILEINFGDAHNSDWTFDFKPPRAAITWHDVSQQEPSSELIQVSPSGPTTVFGYDRSPATSKDPKHWRNESSSTRCVHDEPPDLEPALHQTSSSLEGLKTLRETDEKSKALPFSSGRRIYTEADRSAKQSPGDHERHVVKELCKSLNRLGKNPRQCGRIYAIRDTTNDIVKIGSTTLEKGHRLDYWINNCDYPPEQLKLLEETAKLDTLTQDYRRLEHLIHTDLAPHRRFFMCPCRRDELDNREVQHIEWFAVTDEVVLRTIQVWSTFIRHQPYGTPTTALPGHLKLGWKVRIDGRSKVNSEESHDHHDIRIGRWQALFTLPISSDLASPDKARPKEEMSTILKSEEDHCTPIKPVIIKQESGVEEPPQSENKRATDESLLSPAVHRQKRHNSKALEEKVQTVAKRVLSSEGIAAVTKIDCFSDSQKPFPAKLAPRKPHSRSKSASMPGKQSDSVRRDVIDWSSYQPELEVMGLVNKRPSTPLKLSTAFKLHDIVAKADAAIDQSKSGTQNQAFEPARSDSVPLDDSNRNRSASGSWVIPSRGRRSQRTGGSELKEKGDHENERPVKATREDSSPCHSGARPGLFAKAAFELEVNSFLSALHRHLSKERTVTITGSMYDDLKTLRWPLSCAVMFALQAPFSPPVLSWLLWICFLPLFVRELRCWV